MANAIEAVGREAFTPARREFTARRRAVIAANAELQERELLGLGLTASMTEALTQRGVPDLTARVAAELGALALKIALERWSDTIDGEDYGQIARRTLNELRQASASC